MWKVLYGKNLIILLLEDQGTLGLISPWIAERMGPHEIQHQRSSPCFPGCCLQGQVHGFGYFRSWPQDKDRDREGKIGKFRSLHFKDEKT